MREELEKSWKWKEEEINELKESILQKSQFSKEYDVILEQYKTQMKHLNKENKSLGEKNKLLESKLKQIHELHMIPERDSS